MKINISDISKWDGASLKLDFKEDISGMDRVSDEFEFVGPVGFIGTLANSGGVLKLEGHLEFKYNVRCYRCLKDISEKAGLDIDEKFIDAEKNTDLESYTYHGNSLELDKVLIDNILLHLPMKQICSNECRGLCQKCGADLNEKDCGCGEESINPKMEKLKKFFN